MTRSKKFEISVKDFLLAVDFDCIYIYLMFIILQFQAKKSMIDQSSILNKIDQQTQETRAFANPICKQTYNSLPKIYGKKKKHVKKKLNPVKILGREQVLVSRARQYFSQNEDNRQSSYQKTRTHSGMKRLSQPKNDCHCHKRNCPCNSHSDTNLSQKKASRLKFLSHRKINLPQIRKFDLEDLQSHHKVLMKHEIGTSPMMAGSGLQRIIQQQQQVINKKLVNTSTSPTDGLKSKKFANLKQKSLFKPNFNSKFQIQQEQSEQQKKTQQQKRNKQLQKIKIKSPRFVTEANDSDTPKSRDSISLSSFVFRRAKRQNTNFHDLNVSHASFDDSRIQRKSSVLSNGLFRIPEEPQYRDYLRGYRPLDSQFKIKQLLKKPTFRIIKSQKGVYFGQVNERNQKNGIGINITDRQIFEGQYERNIKIQGYERNIDGVYIGGFQRGLRNGFGTFKWNNGQIYEGKWENGMKNGTGIWKSPKGDYYEGQWKNNRQNGKGIHKHKMSTFIGSFQNFLKAGHGQEKFVNGDKYIGQYCQGRPHGKGRYEWHEGGYYEGQFCKGFREGKGKWVDDQGTIYEGLFKKDFKHGFGKQFYTSGQRFQGQFIQGSRAQGKLFDKEQRYIEIAGK